MPRRVRSKPQRFVPGADPIRATKPTPQQKVASSAASLSKTAKTAQSRPKSFELDKGHRIRGRTAAESESPVPHLLREIHHLQSTTKLQIPKLPFSRLIREVLLQYTGYGKNYRITAECLECLQEAAEIYIVQMFEDSYRCCQHRDRVILCPKDMRLALFLRESWR